MSYRRKFARQAYNVYRELRISLGHQGTLPVDVDLLVGNIVQDASKESPERANSRKEGNPCEILTYDFFGYVLECSVNREEKYVKITEIDKPSI